MLEPIVKKLAQNNTQGPISSVILGPVSTISRRMNFRKAEFTYVFLAH